MFFSFLRSLNLNKVYQIQNPLCYEPYFYKKKSNFDKTSLLVAPKPTKYRCKASKFEKLVADFRLLSIQNAALALAVSPTIVYKAYTYDLRIRTVGVIHDLSWRKYIIQNLARFSATRLILF